MIMPKNRRTLILWTAIFCLVSTGCHEEHQTSRVKTLKVDEHGHVHDENDGHNHDHAAEKRISSH